MESAAVQTINSLVTLVYSGKSGPSRQPQEEKIKIIVSSSTRTLPLDYMYVFEMRNLNEAKDAKDFTNLKEFYYYLKFNGEQIMFRQVGIEGELCVQYFDKNKQKLIAHIKNGVRYVKQTKQSKNLRQTELDNEISEKKQIQQKMKQEPQIFYDNNTLLIENYTDLTLQACKTAKRIVIRYCQMDFDSKECEMKNQREITTMAIQKVLQAIPKFESINELNIQWHKLSSTQAISKIIAACKKLKQLKAITFDNPGNAFGISSLNQINKTELQLEEVSCCFNITDEDGYFEESQWHLEHNEKKNKQTLSADDLLAFAERQKNLTSIWIPKGGDSDIKLLKMQRPWKKLALGSQEDQQMRPQYWNALKELKSNQLSSLCLSRIKKIDQPSLKQIIKNHSQSLIHFSLIWCEGVSENTLEGLAICKLKSLSLRHTSLLEDTTIACKFLLKMDRLQSLCIQNFKGAKKCVTDYLSSKESKSLRALLLPKNQWMEEDLKTINESWLKVLEAHPQLLKLNLYGLHLPRVTNQGTNFQKKDKEQIYVIKLISKMKSLRVLNLGSTNLNLPDICQIVSQLKHLRKLNISDLKMSNTNLNKDLYDTASKYLFKDQNNLKPLQNMDSKQRKEFMLLLRNFQMTRVLKCIPRVTHLDIKYLGIDERPFADMKLVPSLRFLTCEFDLYKQIQSLDRKGITFIV